MKDKIITKVSIFNLVVVVLLIIASFILGFGAHHKTIYKKALVKIHEYENLDKTNENLNKINEEMIEKNIKIGHDLKTCQNEMDSLSTRLKGIKNADDLLKRDIFLYIDKKFQLIPKTVAMKIADQVILRSKEEDVSPELIVGMMEVESGFNPLAISKKNARGLMQVMPEWAKKFKLKKVSDLHDIDTNIQCGIKVLKIHIQENNGSINKGLYYYVGKSKTYSSKVYEAIGRFVTFRSTIDDGNEDGDIDQTQNQSNMSDEKRKDDINEVEKNGV